MKPVKKTRNVSKTESIKVAIRNILYMKNEKEVHGINSVIEAALEYAPELTNEFFDTLLNVLRSKKAEIEEAESTNQFAEAVSEEE